MQSNLLVAVKKFLNRRLLINLILEIHACNNPSPVFKRCLLSAVASTSCVCEVR